MPESRCKRCYGGVTLQGFAEHKAEVLQERTDAGHAAKSEGLTKLQKILDVTSG